MCLLSIQMSLSGFLETLENLSWHFHMLTEIYFLASYVYDVYIGDLPLLWPSVCHEKV